MKHTTEQKIAYALREMGVQQDLKGYKFLKVAIGAVVNEPTMIDSITKKLYPYVANECDTIPMRVERAIRHAIETAYMEMPDEVMYSVFGNSVSAGKGKPTNGHFIAAVAEIISNYEEHLILPEE